MYTQSFLLAQSLFALIPVLLFTSFVLGVLCVALVSALLFILFWIGVAGLVLGGTLFVTFWVAVVVWTWGVGLFLAGRFAYGLVVARQGTGHDVGEKKMREKWEQIVAKKEEEEPEVNGSKTKAIVNGDGEKHEDGSMGNEKEETNGVNGDGAHEEHQDDSTSTVPLNGDASTR